VLASNSRLIIGSPLLHDAERDAPTAPRTIGALSRDEQISISAMERLCPPGHNQAQNARVPPRVHEALRVHPRDIPSACFRDGIRPGQSDIGRGQADYGGAGGLIWIKGRPADAISIVRYSTLASPDWRIP
jgi:hypothetical protein